MFCLFVLHKIHKDGEKGKGNKPLTFSTLESRWLNDDCSRLEKGNTKSAVGKIEKRKQKPTCFIPKRTRKVQELESTGTSGCAGEGVGARRWGKLF